MLVNISYSGSGLATLVYVQVQHFPLPAFTGIALRVEPLAVRHVSIEWTFRDTGGDIGGSVVRGKTENTETSTQGHSIGQLRARPYYGHAHTLGQGDSGR